MTMADERIDKARERAQWALDGFGGMAGAAHCVSDAVLFLLPVVEEQAALIRELQQRVTTLEARVAPQPQPGKLHDAFDALRAAGGDGWDRIDDPEKFLGREQGE